MRTIYLPAIERSVSLRSYLQAVRLAKSKPDATFKHGLTCWYSCTGSDIMCQFRQGMHDRINQAIPYTTRGMQEAN